MELVDIVGWIGVILGLLMFCTLSDQIRLNLEGHSGSILVPIGMLLNSIAWSSYGFLLPEPNWKIYLPNLVGTFFSLITLTSWFIGRNRTPKLDK
jgi:hypothetical protein